MDPQLVNLILEALRSHGQKLDAINQAVTELKTEAKVGQYDERIQKLEAVAWYAKVIVATIGFCGTVAKVVGYL